MKNKIHNPSIFFFLAMFALSFNLIAQDDNDYSNNRGKKKRSAEAVHSEKEPPTKIIAAIVGTWDVEGIFKGDKDISNTDTVGTNQRIEFDREAKYISYSGNERIDSGTYRLNENHAILYLESATDQEPSEWNVTLSNNSLTLQPRGAATSHAQSFKYIYTRASGGTNKPN